MTVKVLKKTVNIELCHEFLKNRLRYDTYQKHHVHLQAAHSDALYKEYLDVVWIERYGFWMYLPDPWQPNALGLTNKMPQSWETQIATCLIDFHPGHTACFGRDAYGGIFLLHSGEFAAQAAHASKAFFWEHYQGLRVDDEAQNSRFAVIGHLGSLDVGKQIKAFVEEITRIGKDFASR